MTKGRYAWVAALALSGCFSEPVSPAADDDGGGSSGSTSNGVTSSPTTTGVTTVTPTSTSSSSGDDVSSGDEETTMVDPSTTTGAESSSGEPGCQVDQVMILGECLSPLVVSGAFTVEDPGVSGPIDEPCIRADCADALPLGGGFNATGVDLHASHRAMGVREWVNCGAADPDVSPNTWQAYARCIGGSGNALVLTETYAIPDEAGPTCYEARCPPLTTLVGGGGRWGPDFRFGGSLPHDDDPNVWLVCGHGADAAIALEVEAYCAVLPAGTGISVHEETLGVVGGDSACVEVGCTDGGVAVSGGVDTAFDITIEASHPDPMVEGWVACARNELPFTVEMRAKVMCVHS